MSPLIRHRKAGEPRAPSKDRGLCSAPNCPMGAHSKGLCSRHYQQFRKYGRFLSHKEEELARRRGSPRLCQVPGCGKKVTAKDCCHKHYSQLRRHGRILSDQEAKANRGRKSPPGFIPQHKRPCIIVGCPNIAKAAKGLCSRHYAHLRRSGKILPEEYFALKPCSAPGCQKMVKRTPHCHRHQIQIAKYGRLTPEKERAPYPKNAKCRAPGCQRRPIVNWHCNKHAQQLKRYGRYTPETERKDYKCMSNEEKQVAGFLVCRGYSRSAIAKLLGRSLPAISYWFPKAKKEAPSGSAKNLSSSREVAIAPTDHAPVSREALVVAVPDSNPKEVQ